MITLVLISFSPQQNWCATEVDSAGQFVGKYAKCRGRKVKEACHQLHELTTTAGQQDLYGEFTEANTGCECWFDLSRSDCACCSEEGVQCGAPMQQWCTSKKEGRQSGCLGVPANHWTLSTTGYPCYWNTSRTDCAWCAPGGKLVTINIVTINIVTITTTQVLSVDLKVRQAQTLSAAPGVGTRLTLSTATPCLGTVSTLPGPVTARPSASSVLRLGRESTGSVCVTLRTGLAMVWSVMTVTATPVRRQQPPPPPLVTSG